MWSRRGGEGRGRHQREVPRCGPPLRSLVVVLRCGPPLWSPAVVPRCGLPLWYPALVPWCGPPLWSPVVVVVDIVYVLYVVDAVVLYLIEKKPLRTQDPHLRKGLVQVI